METQNQTKPTSSPPSRLDNTTRDEATLGVHGNIHNDPSLADEDQPIYRPPETQPEPRPATPTMKSTPDSPA